MYIFHINDSYAASVVYELCIRGPDLGVITIAVSVGRFTTMVYVDNAISIYIWATAEICISVIVVALTAVRPLLRKLTNLKSATLLTSEDRSGVQGIGLVTYNYNPFINDNDPQHSGQALSEYDRDADGNGNADWRL
ncbi:hypothetical protein FBULB1_5809 [Fusarium bulbicola]|nr:hypothetical protein FBULB1_5809 [Fusarium bulbicola]